MPAYDLSGHAMLEDTGLSGGLLDANQIMAESLLGLENTAFTDSAGELAKVAILTQIRFQLSEGVDLTRFSMIARKSRTWIASAAAKTGVSPIAQKLANSLKGSVDSTANKASDGFTVVNSLP